MKNKILLLILLAVAIPASAQSLAAKYACSDFWGRKLPAEERTKDNCAELLTAQDYVDIGRNGRSGASGTVTNTTQQQLASGTYMTPSGSYQVTRAGSTTFIARTSR